MGTIEISIYGAAPVADPGFPKGRERQSLRGAPNYYLAIFSPKKHENEDAPQIRLWTADTLSSTTECACDVFDNFYKIMQEHRVTLESLGLRVCQTSQFCLLNHQSLTTVHHN